MACWALWLCTHWCTVSAEEFTDYVVNTEPVSARNFVTKSSCEFCKVILQSKWIHLRKEYSCLHLQVTWICRWSSEISLKISLARAKQWKVKHKKIIHASFVGSQVHLLPERCQNPIKDCHWSPTCSPFEPSPLWTHLGKQWLIPPVPGSQPFMWEPKVGYLSAVLGLAWPRPSCRQSQ